MYTLDATNSRASPSISTWYWNWRGPDTWLSCRDRVGEHAVLVLELAARLFLGLDADVQPLDEVAVIDLCLGDASQLAHVNAARVGAGAQHDGRVPNTLGNTDLAGEAVARAAGQDSHRRLPPGGECCANDGIGDLVLRAITAVRDHEVNTVGNCCPSLFAGVAIFVGHARIPGHAVFAEDIIENVEDGLVLARGRVYDHMHTRVHGI